MADILDNSIKFLTGVGEKRAELLDKELGISTFRDLLYHFPFRYIDRSRTYRISEATDDENTYIQIKARVMGFRLVGAGGKRRFVAEVHDGSGVAEMVWFAGISWIQKKLEEGREYIFFGRSSMFNGTLNMVHPEIELPMAEESLIRSSIQGVYNTTEKLRNIGIGPKAIFNLVRSLWMAAGPSIKETMPAYMLEQYRLMPLPEALRNIHFPESPEKLHDAEFRLKFEELFVIQLNILRQRSFRQHRMDGFRFDRVGDYFNTFYRERLPFPLTEAQKRVIREIRGDMHTGMQMNRLLQGDVGSGKTIVALMSALIALDNGYQAAIMAPTEILANQHLKSFTELLDGMGVGIALLTGSTRKRERTRIAEGLADGSIQILIGTHALIEDTVQFANLGFVVIDEQHRFGVMQRAKLWTKNHQPPHVLVMTATPIPRTLAMTLYGDLEASVIDELPPGRKSIKTIHSRDSHRMRLFGFMREQIAAGRQIYVVYPLIKESEKMDYKDLEDGYESIVREFPNPQYTTAIVHGKMKPADKDYGMSLFASGEAQIMVSTTVIEVGVNVPNASVMVIESAERFGLSQLHQLRGRVGRGAEQSYCILMSGDKLSADSRKRLAAMVATTDGFELAELDLHLRGPGDLEGTQQSGLGIDLKIANIGRDGQILQYARDAAIAILDKDPMLSDGANRPLIEMLDRLNPDKGVDFGKIS